MMEGWKKAVLNLCGVKVKGYAKEAENGLYWFTTEERRKKNQRDLLVSPSDLKILIK